MPAALPLKTPQSRLFWILLVEISKSKAELAKKKKLGHPIGRPPYGLQYTPDKSAYEPGEGFKKALRVIQLREKDPAKYSFPLIARTVELPQTTVYRIWENRAIYRNISVTKRALR